MSEKWVWRGSTALLAIVVVILLVIIGSLSQKEEVEEKKRSAAEILEYYQKMFPQYGVFLNRPPVKEERKGREEGGLEDETVWKRQNTNKLPNLREKNQITTIICVLRDPQTSGNLENCQKDIVQLFESFQTVIILENTNYNDTMRWINGIIKSRKSPQDLLVYVYKTESIFLPEFRKLRKEIRENQFYSGVDLTPNNRSLLVEAVLKRSQVQYLIDIKDTDYMGYDFADYYYLGKSVMHLDHKIDCVCGGEESSGALTDAFFKPSEGDLLWLSEMDCMYGMMTSRDNYMLETRQSNLCLRPEVWRVSDSNHQVTKMSWNLAQFDPTLLTTREFNQRLNYDFEHAHRLQKVEWSTLKTMSDKGVYMFPFEGEDMQHYFDNDDQMEVLFDSKFYKGILMMHYGGHQVYIVPGPIFRNESQLEDEKTDPVIEFFQ